MKLPSGWKAWNAGLILVFIVVGLFALASARAKADTNISLGQSIIKTELSTGEISTGLYDWEIGYQKIGGDIDILSVSRVIRPDWCLSNICYYQRLGVAYIPNSTLVGNTNYRLGIGIDFNDLFAFEYFHYSSAGIHKINYGLDGIMLRVKLPLR